MWTGPWERGRVGSGSDRERHPCPSSPSPWSPRAPLSAVMALPPWPLAAPDLMVQSSSWKTQIVPGLNSTSPGKGQGAHPSPLRSCCINKMSALSLWYGPAVIGAGLDIGTHFPWGPLQGCHFTELLRAYKMASYGHCTWSQGTNCDPGETMCSTPAGFGALDPRPVCHSAPHRPRRSEL